MCLGHDKLLSSELAGRDRPGAGDQWIIIGLLKAGKGQLDSPLRRGYSEPMKQRLRSPLNHRFALARSATGRAGLLLILAFAILYGLTLDDGLRPGELAGGDLITHQYAQVQGRFSNAPGYPLYTMGGWAWFRMGRLLLGPAANPIAILSSYSTFWALVALGLLYVLILELLVPPDREAQQAAQSSLQAVRVDHGAWLIALLASAFYGVTYFFWYYAVTTEQYTSSVAWTLAFALLLLRWERNQEERYLLGMALLAGIGLAHQITVLASVPPALALILSRRREVLKDGRLVGRAIGLALLPLLSYLYVYVRGAQHPEWRGMGHWESTWQWFWSFVSTEQGRNELTRSLTPFFTHEFPALIWGEMTWPGLILGLLGWLTLGRRRAGFFYGTLVIYLAFCWVDRLGNWYQVIMPVYALLTAGIAAAAAWWVRWQPWKRATEVATSRGRLIRWVLALMALAALVGYRAAASFPRADASNRPDDTGLAPAWAILADDPPRGAMVLTTYDEGLALNYVTQVWGRRPDLTVLTPTQARERFAHAGFLVVTEAALPLVPVEVSAEARYSALGRTLVAAYREPAREMPEGLLPWIYDFAGAARLAGGRLQKNATTGEQVVLLVWLAPRSPAEDWSVSVRLTQGSTELAQRDHVHPVFGAYPMTRWAPGEVVIDAYPFRLPADTVADGLTVILYRRAADGSFINLDVARFSLTAP
ncbi:MAG: protein O-mannosyl-transferase family [Anaerolineae bacterium]